MSAPRADGHDTDPPADDLPATAARIESLLEASSAGGPVARSRAEDLVACVSGLYGAGLRRVLEIIDAADRLDAATVDALAADELVAGLLLVHDLHPYDVHERVRRALDGVRPYLGSHGGDVELVGIDDDGVLTLRLLGSCDGCPSSAVTLELAVEGAVQAAAPELTRIEVQSPSTAAHSGGGGLISLDSLRSRIDAPTEAAEPAGPSGAGAWMPVPDLATLAPGELGGFEVTGLRIAACRIGSDYFCFDDACGRCGASLAGGVVERRLGEAAGTGVLRCPHCHAHFDVRRAGAGLDAVDGAEEHLTALPVLVRDGVPAVAVPTPVSSSAAPSIAVS